MKKTILLLLLFFISISIFSQNKKAKPFFTGDINFTFGINENYVPFQPDDGEELLEFSAIMLRFGAGIQFNTKWSASFNFGYDNHTTFNIEAFPTYGSLRYNITEDDKDTFFTEISYGKMWRPSSLYEDGDYYKFGLGTQIGGESRWNAVIKLDFHRKKIAGFKKGNLDSISLGIGFSFF